MGQAYDQGGELIAEAFGKTKREVFDKLMEQAPNAAELRIKRLADEIERLQNKELEEGRAMIGPPVGQTCQDESPGFDLEAVSSCPSCGAPIYGRKVMRSTDPYAPGLRYSCSCRVGQMQTK